jgi:hypothetical protein
MVFGATLLRVRITGGIVSGHVLASAATAGHVLANAATEGHVLANAATVGHVLASAVTGGEEKLILVPDFSYHVPSEHPKGHR